MALDGAWAPSARMLPLSAVQGVVNALLTGKTPKVALRFTALTGSSQIDDGFIDPHRMWEGRRVAVPAALTRPIRFGYRP